MKLLLDQNLSKRLVPELDGSFPGSRHVLSLGMATSADSDLWAFAKAEGYAIVTKDSDFVELSALFGPPPKVVWLNLGNVPNTVVRDKLLTHVETIAAFLGSEADGVLEIE